MAEPVWNSAESPPQGGDFVFAANAEQTGCIIAFYDEYAKAWCHPWGSRVQLPVVAWTELVYPPWNAKTDSPAGAPTGD